MNGIPNNLGLTVDQLYELRAERIGLEKQVNEMKSQEHKMKLLLIEECTKQNLTKAGGKLASISLNLSTVGTVVDWSKVDDFIYEHKALHLIQRRLSIPAYREYLELENGVPGVEPTVITALSLTRATK